MRRISAGRLGIIMVTVGLLGLAGASVWGRLLAPRSVPFLGANRVVDPGPVTDHCPLPDCLGMAGSPGAEPIPAGTDPQLAPAPLTSGLPPGKP